MRPGASKSSKLRGVLDALDALDGMDVVKVLSRRDYPQRQCPARFCSIAGRVWRLCRHSLGWWRGSVISSARIGAQCSGGQWPANIQAMRPSGCAAPGEEPANGAQRQRDPDPASHPTCLRFVVDMSLLSRTHAYTGDRSAPRVGGR
jgi:hypothetical protein